MIVRYQFLLSLGLIVSRLLLGRSLAEEPFPAPLPSGTQSAGALPFSGPWEGIREENLLRIIPELSALGKPNQAFVT